MRTEAALGLMLAMLAGCAGTRSVAPTLAATPGAVDASSCTVSPGPVTRPALCSYPPDVRGFVEDRDVCDHFRGEPWPEGDSNEDRVRRRQLVDGVRTSCAGTDARLAELKTRHAADARVMALLAEFEARIED